MLIRLAKDEDTKEILKLLIDLGRPKPRNKIQKTKFRKMILDHIAQKDKQVLVAVNDSMIVGVVIIIFLSRLNRITRELWIPELVVSKEQRNKGIGKQLIKICLTIAKQKRCFRIRLESGNKRKDAHAFYKKMGFE